MKVIAKNRKARHDYQVTETLEAGIALTGTEVKSCRAGAVSIAEAHARVLDGELWLIGAHIHEYDFGNRNNHAPRRDRKLLVHKKEIVRLKQATEAKGMTLVPLALGLNRGKIKVEIGVCRGKDKGDKRQALREKAHLMEATRAMRG
ncbi:MAG: SsrA-binding protein SmpB [Lentisphaeria bacterium]|nr:SsrA-binding protein SmpB [Lentisphaeria bacterium]